MDTNKKVWSVSILIWLIGLLIIYSLWNTRIFIDSTLETIFGFILYIISFFYIFTLFPISHWVETNIFTESEFDNKSVSNTDNNKELDSLEIFDNKQYLHFKSNIDAFEYASRFKSCELSVGNYYYGIVNSERNKSDAEALIGADLVYYSIYLATINGIKEISHCGTIHKRLHNITGDSDNNIMKGDFVRVTCELLKNKNNLSDRLNNYFIITHKFLPILDTKINEFILDT